MIEAQENPLLNEVQPERFVEVDLSKIPSPQISEPEKEKKVVETLAGKKRKEFSKPQQTEAKKQVKQEQANEPISPPPLQIELPNEPEEDIEGTEGTEQPDQSTHKTGGFEYGEGNAFAETAIGLLGTFLPMLISSFVSIDEMEVLRAEKSELVPNGSYERVNAINTRNQSVMQQTIAEGTEKIRVPLEKVLAKRSIQSTPEMDLAFALGSLGVSTFFVARDIRKSNKEFLNELMDIQENKKSEKKEKEVEGDEKV